MIKAILFDLDGTLLPMVTEEFTKYYFTFLVKKLVPYGYESDTLIPAVLKGINAMVQNDGKRTNEEAFWNKFSQLLGNRVLEHKSIFEDFYQNEFNLAKDVCGYDGELHDLVISLKEKGFRIILATNPFFPAIGTENRIRWAGYKTEDFELISTYEDFYHCKPNLDYYREVLERIKCKPSECIMIGNDVGEDMIASKLGINVFLFTRNLINLNNDDISLYPHGQTKELRQFLKKCIDNELIV